MSRTAISLCVAALIATAIPARAQTCSSIQPSAYSPAFECPTSTCVAGQTIRFRLSPLSPDALLSCTTATWRFADNTVLQSNFGATVEKALPFGTHQILVDISTPAVSTPLQKSMTLTVERGHVEMLTNVASNTAIFDEGGSHTWTITRTNADVSTRVHWAITESPGDITATPLLSPSIGSVDLAAGEMSRPLTISVPDDSVFKAASCITFACSGRRTTMSRTGP